MSQRFSIFVEVLDGYNKQLTVQVTNSMRIKELRASIAKLLKMHPVNIRLSHNCASMEDSKTIAEFDLQADSKIYVALFAKTISVLVTGVSGETSEEKVHLEDTVESFLERYKEKHENPNALRLTFRGVELSEGTNLSALGISDDDMLLVRVAVHGGEK